MSDRSNAAATAAARRSEVSTALNEPHHAAFTSHLSASGSSMSAAATAAATVASLYSGSILMQGKLMRRDRTFLTWKWRDFTLERTRLQYFSEKGVRKGEIALSPTTPITIRLLAEPKPHAFLLFIKDEKLTLAAANENEQRKWIDVFCDVFHASVEQAPADKGDRRARPTFLPIPDIAKDKAAAAASAHHGTGGSGGGASGGASSATGGAAAAGATHGGGSSGAAATAAGEGEPGAFPEVIPILESRMTYGPIKESYSRITFPPSLANGDLLVGVGPIVRRMGWTDERILAVGLYIDPEGAARELDAFHGRTVKSLYGDQAFYDHLLALTTFRRSFVITARKRVSKSVLTALLHDEVAPRVGAAKDGLDTFLGFIDKSLKKAESMVLRLTPDGRFEYRLRGQLYPPVASPALCKCVQAMFFDVNSIQHDAKRGLIERLPSLWGGEVLDAQDEIFGRVNHHRKPLDESESEYDDEYDDDDGADDSYDDDDDDGGDDGGVADDFIEEGDEGAAEASGDDQTATATGASSSAAARQSLARHSVAGRSSSAAPAQRRSEFAPRKSRRSTLRKRTLSTKEELDSMDEREHESLRRASRSVAAHFGPLLDPDSNAHFGGDLLADSSALLGTWSQQIAVAPESFDRPHDGQMHRFSVGLYVEPGGASETLLKYKGLSVGSIVQDPDFFARFAQGSFRKHLVFQVDARMRLQTLIEYFDAHLKQFANNSSSGGGDSDARASSESFLAAFDAFKHKQLLPKDEVRFTIESDGPMTLFIRKHTSVAKATSTTPTTPTAGGLSLTDLAPDNGDADGGDGDSEESSRSDAEIPLPSAPHAMLFQSVFYGFHTIDAASRTQLMQRLPTLLDLAKDDLVHTYHDEIAVLKENYKRQKPENRVKVGYMAISFEKKKLTKTIDGAKEPTVVPSRWSKRWCRLDGVMFSYLSHKRSRKARDVMDLTQCDVAEITSVSGAEFAPFAVERDSARPSIKIAITKPNGEVLALRTESIYEGEEWLESLTDASKVRRAADDAAATDSGGPPAVWENSMARLRRSSSVYRSLHGATPVETERRKQHHPTAGGGGGAEQPDPRRSVHESSAATNTEEEEECDDGDASGGESDAGAPVDKEGSLVLWVREDPRHALIALLLALVVYLATARASAVAGASVRST
ncbi:hypothetical protein PybrP1_006645 [[Pythium] brassicae (nom. inval.)]|nr:hypothetical protein PybrP1_006645 [[Pythium] brassicae (nom. inval.)]